MTNPNPVAPNTDTPAMQDALDMLAFELYGRKAKAREFIGGSDATILRDAATTLAAERASRKMAGICELAVDNPNLSSYMDHWEGRALKAESALLDAKELIQRMMKEEETLRASRLQADTEQYDKGWNDAIKAAVERADYYDLNVFDYSGEAVAALAKPSVSPEQAEEHAK